MSSEEADRRIAEVRSTGSTRLDLSNLPRGEEVPDSLSDLVSLEQLDLSENKDRLIQVPESIRHLSNLKTLNLNRNYLPQLPEWLGELTLLNELELAHNKLEHLPDSIGQLSQLRRLDFRANEIPVVPEWLRQLPNLTSLGISMKDELHLSPNDFTDLIPDAATNMQELIRGPVTEPMEFLQFASGVFPDTLMVYLQDTDPSDPLVYIDDHETLWQATHTKTLSALLESFITIEQAEEIIDTMAERWVE